MVSEFHANGSRGRTSAGLMVVSASASSSVSPTVPTENATPVSEVEGSQARPVT